MGPPRARFTALKNFDFILAFYVLWTGVASVYKFLLGNANNFFVFKYSFFHLLANKDLYIFHPADHWDLYKYSPTFSLLLGPIAALPDIVGAVAWNLLNLIPLLLAIRMLALNEKQKVFIYWIIFFELLLSLQNFQSNGLTLALMVLGFAFLERGKPFWATLFIVLSAYIKIFGLAAGMLFALYPRKGRTVMYFAFWMTVFALLPLAVVSLPQLKFLYASWYRLLRWDNAASSGLSLSGFFRVYLGIALPNLWTQLAGVILLVLPLLRIRLYASRVFRYTLFCSILIWTIIFNHKAESPTFIIALLGIAIWFTLQKKTPFNIGLMAVSFILISLLTTDLVGRHWRDTIVAPYLLKALPVIFTWFLIQGQLLFANKCFQETAVDDLQQAP
jgi:hypothetical protein